MSKYIPGFLRMSFSWAALGDTWALEQLGNRAEPVFSLQIWQKYFVKFAEDVQPICVNGGMHEYI